MALAYFKPLSQHLSGENNTNLRVGILFKAGTSEIPLDFGIWIVYIPYPCKLHKCNTVRESENIILWHSLLLKAVMLEKVMFCY